MAVTNPIYRWFLRFDDSADRTQVHPIWKGDTTLDYKRESGQMFYRKELSSSLTFVRDEYRLIRRQDFETQYSLDCEISTDMGLTWSAYFTGTFYITDCTVNVGNEKLTVKPTLRDRYSDILAGLEKEYDLIPLAPALTPVYLTRRPMLQVYVPGEDIVTCILGGQSWTQEVTESTTDEGKLKDDYHFGNEYSQVEMNLDTTITGLTAAFTGTLDFPAEVGEWLAFQNEQGVYRIYYFQESTVNLDPDYKTCKNGLRIKTVSDNTLVWQYERSVVVETDYPNDWREIPTEFVFTGVGTMSGTNINASYIQTGVFGRWVLAGDKMGTYDAYHIPDGDIVANNRNYRWCYPYNASLAMLVYNTGESTDPTEWGIKPNGKYYVKPPLSGGVSDYFPIARNNWNKASIWLKRTDEMDDWEVAGRWESYLRDAYMIENVIKVLLRQFAPNIVFAGTSDYSQFLFGANPLVYAMIWGRLFLSPKSNIMKIEYSQPARKAMITLKDVFDMMRKVMNLYWFIDDNNHLRIEHISWFRRGGSYSGQPQIGIDTTTLMNPRNDKPWCYGQDEYNFDKLDMAERYQYGWMDDATNFFNGKPIEVLSKYVSEGRIEEVNVAQFNADVDYLMLNPSDVSEDGFVLINALPYFSSYKTSIQEVDGVTIQNWQMGFQWTQPNFLLYDMPAWDLKVNGQRVVADSVQQKKKQQMAIPIADGEPDTGKLVKTTLGDGNIEKASINLSSRMMKMTLIFETSPKVSPSDDPRLFADIFNELRVLINNKAAGVLAEGGATHDYLLDMYNYAITNAATLYDAEVFSLVLPQSGTLITNPDRAKIAQMSWLMACCLVEICPKIQNDIYNIGYGFYGAADTQRVYGYTMDSDVNVGRMVASVLFAMHRPDASTLEAAARSELALIDVGNALGTTRGTTIPIHSAETLAACADGTRFMPSTPTNNSQNPEFAFDEDTWGYIYANFYYSNGAYNTPRAAQAVADSSATDMASQKQMYEDVGVTMTTAQENLITPCYKWGSRIATPMKDGFDSVSQTTYPGYASNPRTDAEFRMRPFEFHNVHLLDPNDNGASYLNTSSYPSGHTSFGWNIALIFIETHRASMTDVKKIMKRAFEFGQSRVIGRYHWQEDVIHGYVIGSACIPRLHAYTEYINLLALT